VGTAPGISGLASPGFGANFGLQTSTMPVRILKSFRGPFSSAELCWAFLRPLKAPFPVPFYLSRANAAPAGPSDSRLACPGQVDRPAGWPAGRKDANASKQAPTRANKGHTKGQQNNTVHPNPHPPQQKKPPNKTNQTKPKQNKPMQSKCCNRRLGPSYTTLAALASHRA
jgi:hypothetical protein